MRRTRGCLGNPPTFLAVCKKCSRRLLRTGDAGNGPPGSTHSYPDWAAFPAAFFIACGQPNQVRCSPPLLTVLLLLTEEHLEEGDGASEREDGIPGVWALQGSFLSDELLPTAGLSPGFHPTNTPIPLRRKAWGLLHDLSTDVSFNPARTC